MSAQLAPQEDGHLHSPTMAPFITLRETEDLVARRLGHLPLDAPAMHAMSSIHRAANATRTHITNRVLRHHDVSWTGFVVLWSVWIYDGLPTWQAAQSASISKATLTGVVQTLESRGWLERSVDPADRRMVNLRLTDSGNELMEHLFPEVNAVESEVLGALSPELLGTLTERLRLVVERVEDLEPDEG